MPDTLATKLTALIKDTLFKVLRDQIQVGGVVVALED
jgi:hypothetical protein